MTPEPMDFKEKKKGDGDGDEDDDDDDDGAESVASSVAPPSTVASKQSGKHSNLDPAETPDPESIHVGIHTLKTIYSFTSHSEQQGCF